MAVLAVVERQTVVAARAGQQFRVQTFESVHESPFVVTVVFAEAPLKDPKIQESFAVDKPAVAELVVDALLVASSFVVVWVFHWATSSEEVFGAMGRPVLVDQLDESFAVAQVVTFDLVVACWANSWRQQPVAAASFAVESVAVAVRA